MNRWWLLSSLVLFSTVTFAQESVPVINFDSVADPVKLPADVYLGEVTGVAVNSKGHIFVLSRGNTTGPAYAAAAAQLLEFDATGKFVREIGKNLYAWSFGHSVRIDREDNIWATDKGSDMVIKFNPQGRVVMVFGRKQEASDEDTGPLKHPKPPLPPEVGRFRQVTDVTWDPAGNIYISDGYINSRIAKADKNGKWLKSFGEPGNKPGQLNTPHNIAADAQGNIYVADRGNRRIQVFDGEGTLLREIRIDVPVAPGAQAAIGAIPDVAKLEAAFQEELQKALKDGFTQEELEFARKTWLQGEEAQRQEDREIAGWLNNSLYLGRSVLFQAELESKVRALKLDEVNAALRKYLDPAKLVVVKAGDFTRAEKK